MQPVIPVVKAYILQTFLQGESPENLGPDTELMRSGILDSLATLDLVAFLESTFGIQLEAHDVGNDNLATLQNIEALVHRKVSGA